MTPSDTDRPRSGPGTKISPKPDLFRFWSAKHRLLDPQNMISFNFRSPKIDFWRPNIFFLVIRPLFWSTINNQQSAINNPQSTINKQQSTIINQQ
jgi:hypothetical protein